MCLKDVARRRRKRVVGIRAVRAGWLKTVDGRWISPVEQIEDLKKNLGLNAFSETEALGNAQIRVDKWRGCEAVARIKRTLTGKVQACTVEQTVSIEIGTASCGRDTIVAAALASSTFHGSCTIP